ncbi:Scr1 family TA system antitoxin-like transcriptional regulator [Amycolatopsis sp. Poz14]|uniref:Scr1 family TA system antitoxin-like transcriptional regulator n=1 Tax=Amycolatopsis sp. Poz14 TaxID=1447705 RepID=UPI001EE83109|nr:Scr1 family TA system antitoxin-like transcriptional regulator [Amycolatopsis sp. Poz14]MCG3755844.1 helix-turn-helix transcriptional regulator [Amycolatopsis sp. Poz14]
MKSIRPLIRTVLLGLELRAARGDKWRGRELARRIGVNPALLHNWERGERTPPLVDVGCIVGALGIVGEQKERILELARLADTDSILLGRRGQPYHVATAAVCARAAAEIVDWHPTLVPDILQIPSYSCAVAKYVLPERTMASDPHARFNENTAHLRKIGISAYVGEYALVCPVGDPDVDVVMRQLHHLIKLQRECRGITVRIVPATAHAHLGHSGAFTTFRTHNADHLIVHRSHGYSGSFTLDEDGSYADADSQLSKIALTAEDSVRIIIGRIKKLHLARSTRHGASPGNYRA